MAQVRQYMFAPSAKAMSDLRQKVAYINTLAMVARNKNFDVEAGREADDHARRLAHGLAAITGRLHRIAELGLNLARQYDYLSAPAFLDEYDLDVFFDEINLALGLIRPALEQQKIKLVVRVCQAEENLDLQYAIRFDRLIKELDEGCGQPANRVTALMIIHYLERIGDSLLEIGEEMIYVISGHNLKFSQYQALGVGLKASGRAAADLEACRSIWSGRSGCRINVVAASGGEAGAEPVLFKHGPAAKMEEERASIEEWSKLWPGLPPAVQAFVPAGPRGEAGLLLEYINGETLHDIFMSGDFARGRRELAGALHLMAGIWRETRVETPARPEFVRQAEKRLGPVRTLYPDLVNFRGAFGPIAVAPLDDVMRRAREAEAGLAAPFSARIHGDFNLTNVMRDDRGAYRLIDLHRSRLFDYAQDVSVMMMSVLRLPLSAASARVELSAAALLVFTFARDFAAQCGDETIEARLAFGLARSYLTSARFEPRHSRAAAYIGYARHLWEDLAAFHRAGSPWPGYKIDQRLLYV